MLPVLSSDDILGFKGYFPLCKILYVYNFANQAFTFNRKSFFFFKVEIYTINASIEVLHLT